jgi:ubiquitin thioesterase protein OTUB1
MDSGERPSDEEILKFEKEILKQEVGDSPLVSELLNFEHLEEEYATGLSIFKEKIKSLKEKCYNMRTVKKDGNCFYRAFSFRFCELVREREGTEWHNFIISQCEKSKQILIKMGYDMTILEDFWEPFYEALTNQGTNLLDMFTTEYTSDTIVCFLRILTAAFLKSV